MDRAAPFIRIGLRYLGGALIGWGYATEDDLWVLDDPELVGAISVALSEGWYLLAKKFGWAK